jgi:two-component system sensor histidine kinase KdpD
VRSGSQRSWLERSPVVARWRSYFPALRGYLGGLAVIGAATGLSVASATILQSSAFLTLFPFAVLVVTARFGVGPAIATAVAGVLAFDYVFVPPAFAFAWPDLKDGLTLLVMIAVAALAGVLAQQLRLQVERASRQAEAEHLRNSLLSAISHDLRTPLTALVGASTALCEDRLGPDERNQFVRLVAEEARRLNRFVGRLLELTRLNARRASARRELQAIDEVIGAALCRLERQLEGRSVRTDVPEEVPFAAFDPVLIEQVMINLIENVIRHAGPASPVDIAARLHQDGILVEVADRGGGVRPGDEERVFDKLYRGRGDCGDGGTGLGLTICRAIVAAHDGRIWLENRPAGGAIVRFTLPIRSPASDLDSGLGASRVHLA